MKITNARPIRISNSYCFIIPIALIKGDIIKLNKRYDLELTENLETKENE